MKYSYIVTPSPHSLVSEVCVFTCRTFLRAACPKPNRSRSHLVLGATCDVTRYAISRGCRSNNCRCKKKMKQDPTRERERESVDAHTWRDFGDVERRKNMSIFAQIFSAEHFFPPSLRTPYSIIVSVVIRRKCDVIFKYFCPRLDYTLSAGYCKVPFGLPISLTRTWP